MMMDQIIVHIHRIAEAVNRAIGRGSGFLADGSNIPILMQISLGVLLLVQLAVNFLTLWSQSWSTYCRSTMPMSVISWGRKMTCSAP